jgi:hypothetical protein
LASILAFSFTKSPLFFFRKKNQKTFASHEAHDQSCAGAVEAMTRRPTQASMTNPFQAAIPVQKKKARPGSCPIWRVPQY